MIATNPLDFLRPFLWIAAVAFVLGFAGYALFGAGSLARTAGGAGMVSPIDAPATPDRGPTISV